ncbi:MAG: FtsW/RodA/SpoVE family cell cycle protein [Tannerella sp.]|jgi:cell division protein FtsW|nr:FtsW/RodA/SpoVE family cell cycle protein [Tannerella sp.]
MDNYSAKALFKGDIAVWIIFMLLCCFSLVEVFSATSTLAYKQANIWQPIVRHASFLFTGCLFVLGLPHIHYKFFSLGILLLPLALLLLCLTYIIGVTTNDASRWLVLMGIQFQPSEVGKLACIIYVSFWLSKRSKFSDDTVYKIIVLGVGLVCFLIFPANFSTAILLGVICFLLMFIGQIPLKKLGKLLGTLFIAGLIGVLALQALPKETTKKYFPHRVQTWKNRISNFLDPKIQSANNLSEEQNTYKITDENYQESHAKIAIARGGILGKLPGQSRQRDFLPQAYSDFIYAIILEEIGVTGGIIVLLLYVMLMIRVGIIAKRCEKLFPKYLVIGCGLMIVVQAFVHMGINVGLFPVTGQPLPLISRGGTSTVLTCIYIGIILSISHFGAKMTEEENEDEEGILKMEVTNADVNEENPAEELRTGYS